MTGLTPDEKRRLHDLAEQIAEIAEHHEGQWKVQTTDGMILVAMVSPTERSTAAPSPTPSATPPPPAAGPSTGAGPGWRGRTHMPPSPT